MPRVVINKDWSGIELSAKAMKMLVDKDSDLLIKHDKVTFWGKSEDGSTFLPDDILLNDFLAGCVLYDGCLFNEPWQILVLNGVWYEAELDKESRRSHPDLVWLVETLGKELSPERKYCVGDDRFRKIEIIEVPDDVDWEVWSADRGEWVREKHRTWGLD